MNNQNEIYNLTFTQKQVIACLKAGNTMNDYAFKGYYRASNGEKFLQRTVESLLAKNILKPKYERFDGNSAKFVKIVLA